MRVLPHEASKELLSIITLLTNGQYQKIESLTSKGGLTADEMCRAIDDYGQKLTTPTSEELNSSIDAIKINCSNKEAWSIQLPLWTEEEGESDLTLEVTVTLSNGDGIQIQIENIHIL
ncbi:hypothetical protein LOY37_15600 [Pseudomonas sp. B21-012]|uniref:DUF7668 domain-containing protein n=1 Tax=Pseudomonas sp. B21-012 TaxID=2895472 RepID=UPI00215FF4F8|nr:hypothetical protein [Pseudomonas sp. B21-012]UVM53796.1 hypothetical protein LOY37_15600 [Pseudomonas sp. B21-012]